MFLVEEVDAGSPVKVSPLQLGAVPSKIHLPKTATFDVFKEQLYSTTIMKFCALILDWSASFVLHCAHDHEIAFEKA